MGNIILNEIERRFNNGANQIDINLIGTANPHLNLLKHCKLAYSSLHLGSLIDVRKLYDKFRSLCQGKNYKYVTKRALHEILPFSLITNCRIYDNFNVKNNCKLNVTN